MNVNVQGNEKKKTFLRFSPVEGKGEKVGKQIKKKIVELRAKIQKCWRGLLKFREYGTKNIELFVFDWNSYRKSEFIQKKRIGCLDRVIKKKFWSSYTLRKTTLFDGTIIN